MPGCYENSLPYMFPYLFLTLSFIFTYLPSFPYRLLSFSISLITFSISTLSPLSTLLSFLHISFFVLCFPSIISRYKLYQNSCVSSSIASDINTTFLSQLSITPFIFVFSLQDKTIVCTYISIKSVFFFFHNVPQQ